MSTELELEEVLYYLEEITDTRRLGVCLGIRSPGVAGIGVAAAIGAVVGIVGGVLAGDSNTTGTAGVGVGDNLYRNKEQMIDYWLQTSPDASWTTLAKAVERMGGHDELAKKLRCRAEQKKT